MQEDLLEASVKALFRRCPDLCGFTVEHVTKLCVSEITIHPSDAAPQRNLRGEIVAALATLIEEFPETGELLRERTFARVFH